MRLYVSLLPLFLLGCDADRTPTPDTADHDVSGDTDVGDPDDTDPADTPAPPTDSDAPGDTDPAADTDLADTDPGDTDIEDTDLDVIFDPNNPCASGVALTPVTNPVDISPAVWDWSSVSFGALTAVTTAVIRTDADYATFQTTYNLELPAVNFTTREVVAAWHTASSTCGISRESPVVSEVTGVGRIRLDARFTDASAGCEDVCDAEGGAMVVVSVPRAADVPFVCRSVAGGCEG